MSVHYLAGHKTTPTPNATIAALCRPYNWQLDPVEYDRDWKSADMLAAITAHRYPTHNINNNKGHQ